MPGPLLLLKFLPPALAGSGWILFTCAVQNGRQCRVDPSEPGTVRTQRYSRYAVEGVRFVQKQAVKGKGYSYSRGVLTWTDLFWKGCESLEILDLASSLLYLEA